MSVYEVVREYPYPVEDVWEVVTAAAWVAQWTTTGQSGRPEGFTAEVGTQFRFVGKPTVGWAGVVYCGVPEVDPPYLLRYTWRGDQDSDDVTEATCRLEPVPGGTRLTWRHTGFTGTGGFAMSKLLGRVRRTMLTRRSAARARAPPRHARGTIVASPSAAGGGHGGGGRSSTAHRPGVRRAHLLEN